MSNPLIKFGFAAGVISPTLTFRSDIDKYDLALREGRNWFIDYFGGASTRAGTEFLDYIQDDNEPCRIFAFRFNSNIANTYLILFAKDRIRFLQNGSYVLASQEAFSPGIAVGAGGVVNLNAHGYSNNDMVKINGFTCIVANATANTFTILRPSGVPFSLPGGIVNSIDLVYTIASPYATSDLRQLCFDQDKDVVYITHNNYPRRKLSRLAENNWTLTEVNSGRNTDAISSLTLTPSGSGTTGMVFAVTPIDLDGKEGVLQPASLAFNVASVNYTTAAGELKLSWPQIANTRYYNVYRSLLVTADSVNYGMDLGFLGLAYGPEFTDNNIIPDFTRAPTVVNDPFISAGIEHVNITTPGSGYHRETTSITATDATGSGFQAAAIVNSAGALIGARVLNPGSNYTSPTIVITDTDMTPGTGAAATAILTPTNNSNPACSAAVQQRRVYGGTLGQPGALFGSTVGQPDNFDSSFFNDPSGPYVLTLDQPESTPIRHIRAFSEGMFVFTESSVWRVQGIDDGVIEGGNAKARPQSQEGSSIVPPLTLDQQFLYYNSGGTEVISLRPANLPTYYESFEVSQLSSHYFQPENQIVSWTWAKAPYRLLWAAREDGTLLSLTFVPGQNLYAWTEHTTAGFFEDVEAVLEFGLDRVYAVVRRTVQGQTRRYLERFAERAKSTVEEMWAVDCGLQNALDTPAASVTPSAAEGVITLTADAGVFSSSDVGRIFRSGTAKGVIQEVLSPFAVTIRLFSAFSGWPRELRLPPSIASGDWTLAAPFSSFSNLDHLEGETVEILADGKSLVPQVVFNGSITLPEPASLVTVGLGFQADLEILPPSLSNAIVEHRLRNVSSVAIRLHKARGLELGDRDDFYPLSDPEQLFDTAPEWRTGLFHADIAMDYDYEGTLKIRKSGPVSATVLGLVTEYNFGDG